MELAWMTIWKTQSIWDRGEYQLAQLWSHQLEDRNHLVESNTKRSNWNLHQLGESNHLEGKKTN